MKFSEWDRKEEERSKQKIKKRVLIDIWKIWSIIIFFMSVFFFFKIIIFFSFHLK